jgi:lysophospholipase L1-like esterase
VPLGDSITEVTCWRTTLWDDLVDAGVADKVEYVGSRINNWKNCVGKGTWDLHHEGHSGILAIDVANNELERWLASSKPDIVIFMLGTNDVANGKFKAEIIGAYTKMVQLMRASNPNMKIIVRIFILLPWTSDNLKLTIISRWN